MGRTLLPYSMQMEMVRTRLQSYRSGLRREDRQIFDRLMRVARSQLQAGVMAANPNPFDTVFISILIDLQRQILEQEALLAELQKKDSELAAE